MIYGTKFGEDIVITGSERFLGSWQPTNGIKLQWSEGNRWFKSFNVSQLGDMHRFEFKFVVLRGQQHRWEGAQNHLFDLAFIRKQLNSDDVK